jgi:NAD(P)-dependent dehydrogenase (short-subunit alcohol dehydrogenase family)
MRVRGGRCACQQRRIGSIREGYERVAEEQWRETWELLFLSAVRITNAVLPGLLQGGGGTIVNVSSRNARVPVQGVPGYSAAKTALNNYSKGWRLSTLRGDCGWSRYRRVRPLRRCGSVLKELLRGASAASTS